MSKQQRDAIDAALRAEPFGLNQTTDEADEAIDEVARFFTRHLSQRSLVADSGMQGGPVDKLLGVAVERPALDQLEVEVVRTPEDRLPSRSDR